MLSHTFEGSDEDAPTVLYLHGLGVNGQEGTHQGRATRRQWR